MPSLRLLSALICAGIASAATLSAPLLDPPQTLTGPFSPAAVSGAQMLFSSKYHQNYLALHPDQPYIVYKTYPSWSS
jgi:hypothetical protein